MNRPVQHPASNSSARKAAAEKVEAVETVEAQPARPYREGTPLVAVSESEWDEAQEAFSQVIELQDALANANAYVERLPDKVADFLLSYSGDGDTSDPQGWQAGHNYAMREAARMVRETWYALDEGDPTPEDGYTASPVEPETSEPEGGR